MTKYHYVKVRVRSIHCKEDQWGEAGKDNIEMGGVAIYHDSGQNISTHHLVIFPKAITRM